MCTSIFTVWETDVSGYCAIWLMIFGYTIYRVFCFLKLDKGQELSFKRTFSRIHAGKRRKIGDIPPVYPNGWFGLLESSRVRKSDMCSVTAFGHELAVFRDDKGNVHVLDAYCPHLGANVAVGGRVVDGACIQCPFHGLKFNGKDGMCVNAHMIEAQQLAKLKPWHCTEKNGWIFVWYHAENEEPSWIIPDIPEIAKGVWKFMAENEHIINTHIQIGPGIAHFNFQSLFGKFVVVHTITPIEPMIQKYTRSIYMHWALPKLFGTLYMLADDDQIQRDILIWSNKTYVAKPMYSSSKEDSIIARHRRWYSQFYSENSPRWGKERESLDW